MLISAAFLLPQFVQNSANEWTTFKLVGTTKMWRQNYNFKKRLNLFIDLKWLSENIHIHQHLPSDLFGGFKWPFQGVSDLHLGDQRVTWKKLAYPGCWLRISWQWWSNSRGIAFSSLTHLFFATLVEKNPETCGLQPQNLPHWKGEWTCIKSQGVYYV